MIKINVNTGIPVEIGTATFTVDTSDANISRIQNEAENIFTRIAESDAKDIEGVKETLGEAFDFLLGEGAFEQVYEQAPSVLKCAEILQELVVHLTNEIGALTKPTQAQQANEFLRKKKKKQK